MSAPPGHVLALVLADLNAAGPVEARLRRLVDHALGALDGARGVLLESASHEQLRPLVVRPPGASLEPGLAAGGALERASLRRGDVAQGRIGDDDTPVLVVPLVRAGRALGVLRIEGKPGRRAYAPEDERLAVALGHAAAVALSDARDPLTELRRAGELLDVLQAETERAVRHERPLALVAFDVDHLKRINDTRGHLEGDRALARLADAIRTRQRISDVACRQGGDELCVVLPETSCEGARAFADAIRAAARELGITVSAGVACVPDDARDPHGLLRAADRRLYLSKSRGRDATSAED